jgi:hypothetical protein
MKKTAPTKSAMTPAERQKASRAKRKLQTFDGYSPILLSILLSAEALQVLSLMYGTANKTTIEKVLIEAYEASLNKVKKG